MGSLIFNCPTTWRVIEAGIETDQVTYERIRSRDLLVDCRYCARTHQFRIADGHLFEMGPRRKHIHSPALLCDEIDVGGFIVRSVGALAARKERSK